MGESRESAGVNVDGFIQDFESAFERLKVSETVDENFVADLEKASKVLVILMDETLKAQRVGKKLPTDFSFQELSDFLDYFIMGKRLSKAILDLEEKMSGATRDKEKIMKLKIEMGHLFRKFEQTALDKGKFNNVTHKINEKHNEVLSGAKKFLYAETDPAASLLTAEVERTEEQIQAKKNFEERLYEFRNRPDRRIIYSKSVDELFSNLHPTDRIEHKQNAERLKKIEAFRDDLEKLTEEVGFLLFTRVVLHLVSAYEKVKNDPEKSRVFLKGKGLGRFQGGDTTLIWISKVADQFSRNPVGIDEIFERLGKYRELQNYKELLPPGIGAYFKIIFAPDNASRVRHIDELRKEIMDTMDRPGIEPE